MWRRKRLTCYASGRKCEFNVVRDMVYHSPDGKVFRVRRLVCRQCGDHTVVASQQNSAFVPPAWEREAAVEANF